ncbi:MAG: hypothetical protein P4L53_05835 [Candidatus Obscuribacterales bacterium]|nr:hypothetical protein [Candidatus Obscuribacterales bacterium]
MKHAINRAFEALIKSKLTKSIGMVIALALTSLAFAAPAQAYVWSAKFTYAPVGHGGSGLTIPGNPNCYTLVVANGARQIPAVANFIYCGSITPPASNSNLNAVLGAYSAGMSSAAANTLVNVAQYQVVYFETLNDYCLTITYSVGPNQPRTFAQQCTDAVTYIRNEAGKNTTGPGLTSTTQLYQAASTGAYPASAQVTNLPHVALHEAGHAFDWARGDGTLYLSQQNQVANGPLVYFGALVADYVRLGGCASGIWLSNTQNYYYSYYFHCANTNGVQNDFEDLFAEEFAMGASGSLWQTSPPYESVPSTIDTSAIAPTSAPQGTACANLYVWYYMNYLQPPTASTYASYGLTGTCTGLGGTGLNAHTGG